MTARAITLPQPNASLCARGVQRWLTRPAPPTVDPPFELLLHAGARAPDHDVGDWFTNPSGDDSWVLVDREMALKATPEQRLLATLFPEDRFADGYYPLPLGAIVGVCTVTEALPIVEETGDNDAEVYQSFGGSGLFVQRVIGNPYIASNVKQEDIDDQLPYADWTPGRWAWRLSDVRALDKPIKARGRSGLWTPDQALIDEVGT